MDPSIERVGVGFVEVGVSRMYIGWCLERWCLFGSHAMLMTSEVGARTIISFRRRLLAVMVQVKAKSVVFIGNRRKKESCNIVIVKIYLQKLMSI